MAKLQLFSGLPKLNSQVWVLAFGRLLSEIGSGFTLIYAPIFFVNQVGLSPTQVGLGIGIASLSGIVGRIFGGSLSDLPAWGRKRTLLLSTVISAIASLGLAATRDFSAFVIAKLLMEFSIGLYWPATEALVTDLTEEEHRREGYAITRLADNLGQGLGVLLGGIIIGTTGAYRILFIVDAVSFILFLGVIQTKITDNQPVTEANSQPLQGWLVALRDRTLLIYVVVNVIFTTYISQVYNIMPLYFKNFVDLGSSGKGFSEIAISFLFTWYMVLAIIFQLPVARFLKLFSHTHSLILSALLWGIGFICIGFTGIADHGQIVWAILGTAVLAIAAVSYTPSASSIVADIAPIHLRAVYFSINSLCWAIGYFIGPPLGGWALSQSPQVANQLWLTLALSVGLTIAILEYLKRTLSQKISN